jgi:hypothetical protein
MIPSPVIASQRVGAKRRPMTGSAKQSISWRAKLDFFVAYAPRNDEKRYCDAKLVMPGLVPGIHVLDELSGEKDVDGRDKPGHDEKANRFVAAGISQESGISQE